MSTGNATVNKIRSVVCVLLLLLLWLSFIFIIIFHQNKKETKNYIYLFINRHVHDVIHIKQYDNCHGMVDRLRPMAVYSQCMREYNYHILPAYEMYTR